MKNLYVFPIMLIALIFFSKSASAQVVEIYVPPTLDTALIKGRIIGANLQNIKGATITNKRTNKKDTTNIVGFYTARAAVGDTLFFDYPGLSREVRKVKKLTSKMNVILIRRKIDSLPAHTLKRDSSNAEKADEELYRILEKDAKLEGKWNY